MASPNRTALLNKAHRILKQHYKPVPISNDRPLLEHILFACCLENASYEAAERIYDHLSKSFFDWNEVRVSTVTELSEAMHSLPDPAAAASNLKRVLQGVFESTYSFELESLKKQNISQAIKHLEKLGGSTPFVLAYATQVALGGHAIPLDRGALDTLFVLGILSEAEARSGKVTGFERVIPKNKGVEFASLLHQLAADYHSNPFSPNVRKLMLSINPDAKDRFPKRGAKKEPEKAEPAAAKKGTGERPVAKSPEKPPDKAHAKHGDRAVEKSAARTSEKPSDKHHDKQAGKHPPHPSGKRPEPPAEKPATEKPAAKKKAAAEKSSAKPHPVSPKRKPATKQLAKRKPR